MNKAFKRFFRAVTLIVGAVLVTGQGGSSLSGTVHAWPPPGVDFCAWARAEADGCWRQYESCGGLEADGCYDQLQACLEDSGIWYCE